MSNNIRKGYYDFKTKEEADTRIAEFLELETLGTFGVIGNPVTTEATYNNEGEIITEAIKDETKYLVNFEFRGVETNENGLGVHFWGWKQFAEFPQDAKFERWGMESVKGMEE